MVKGGASVANTHQHSSVRFEPSRLQKERKATPAVTLLPSRSLTLAPFLLYLGLLSPRSICFNKLGGRAYAPIRMACEGGKLFEAPEGLRG